MSVSNLSGAFSQYSAPYNYAAGGYHVYLNATSITLYPGHWRDSTNSFDIILSTPVVISTSLIGVPNGVDTDTQTVSPIIESPVYVYVIADSTGHNPTAGLFCYGGNTAGFDPILPQGYNIKRRIGSLMTNSVSQTIGNIRPFSLSGTASYRQYTFQDSRFYITNPLILTSNTSFNNLEGIIDARFPSVADSIYVTLAISGSSGTAGDCLYVRTSQSNNLTPPTFVTASNAYNGSYTAPASNTSFWFYGNFVIYNLQYRFTSSSDSGYMYTGGYTDSVA